MKWILLIVLTGCSAIKDIADHLPKPEKKEPMIVTHFPKEEWGTHAYKLIQNSPLAKAKPSDAKDFCPNGMNIDNWVSLLAAITKRESGFDPESEYEESFNDKKGNHIISTGLMQLSLESSRGYNCGFKEQRDLKDPLRNLECGVKILERWVIRDGRITGYDGDKWRGGARFWSVLRSSINKTINVLRPWCT